MGKIYSYHNYTQNQIIVAVSLSRYVGKSKRYILESKRATFLIFRGMTVTSGVVRIQKDDTNLIGISIGGGAPLCPCLYIVQVQQLQLALA